MFWESSLSFNIVQQPLLLSLFFPFIHLSLSLRSGVSLSGSVLQRWVLQLSPAPGPEQEPRGPVGGGCLGQKAQPIWKQKHTLRYLYATLQTQIWRLCLFFWTSLRRTCTSSCLSPTAWSIWICQAQTALWTQWVSILSVYLLAEDRQMFYVQRLKKKEMHFSLYSGQPRLTVSTLCLMQLFGALLRGCCADLSFLNLSKNSFSHRLVMSLRLPKQ